MDLTELTHIICTEQRCADLKALLAGRGRKHVTLDGLAGSSAAIIFNALPRRKSPYLVIASDLDEAGYLYSDLVQCAGDEAALFFPSGYKRDIRYGQVDAPSEILRTQVLGAWGQPHSALRWVVTYPEALAERVQEPRQVAEAAITLAVGDTANMGAIAKRLNELGFERADYVYEPGEYAIRGSILDVFSYNNELPLRVDFFGDDIDSIRSFDVETQLSRAAMQSVKLLGNSGTAGTGSKGVSLLHYVGDDTVLLCRDAQQALQRIEAVCNGSLSASAEVAGDYDTTAMEKLVSYGDLRERLLSLSRIDYYPAAAAETPDSLHLQCSPQGIFHKNFDLIEKSFNSFLAAGYTIYILSDSASQCERLRSIFADRGQGAITFTAVPGALHEGFVDPTTRSCVFTDHQIFDRFHKYTLKSERARGGKLALSLKELKEIAVGDYVVHVDHGVGRFGGLVRTTVNGTMQEMIKITYQGGDVIFVSIHSLHKIAKYRGKEGVEPRLNKLGTGAWNKLKERTKTKLKDIARDLIRLYAARKAQQGFAFSPDSYLQHELEASFVYEDTPDQVTATRAVKADMESRRPMDRLICGDVGFGKTEVAIRAAFKAATDGKQTAVLVPTTVLAFQHFKTFSERLRDFPVRVDYLSRARKPKDVKALLDDLREGKVDIIIGTHKLIGKTVQFHDLGLLVVDEEQKFGVAVKDRLKQLKVNVDTLTMSATPIPRTLQFSLMGARDLSAITTPPANRYPILTTVCSMSDDIIGEAIGFELSRGGQVFVVNNHIDGLTQLKAMVQRLVPDARVAVGHGQMPPEKLEQTILDFAAGQYDVLISTTIIESGVDMPNVNTMIINNAHRFGLSELHQLRGRVGRSSRKAFCYLITPPQSLLTPEARRRLQAIESFADLGSGIHIAMQDLDIRGAGNLLGAEQSGFIADLGYETYQKILKEAVLELSTQEFADTFNTRGQEEKAVTDEDTLYTTDCTVETDLEVLLPATYVPQEGERISLYQELDAMERESDVQQFRERLEDRFGKIPPEADELIRIVGLRRTARSLGIEKLVLRAGEMYLYFVGDENRAYYQSPAFGRILRYMQANLRRSRLRESKQGKRSMLVGNVPTVRVALDVLTEITKLEAL